MERLSLKSKPAFYSALAAVSVLALAPCAWSDGKNDKKDPPGKMTFDSHCAQCHMNGQNKVKPSKPIAGSDVLVSFVTFENYLDKPIGTMPHYEHLIEDHDTLMALYKYVKTFSKPGEKSEKGNQSKKSKKAKSKKTSKKTSKKKSVKP